MKLNKLTSLLLVAIAISAVRCSKESTPATPDKPADAPKPAATSAPATGSATAPKASTATLAPAATTAKTAGSAMPAASAALAAAADATGPDPRADLKTLIPELTKVLEAKDYASIFKKMMPPSMLADMPPGLNIDMMVGLMSQDPEFQAEMADNLKEMQAIKDQTPTMDPSGNKATYTLNPPIGKDKEVVFVKENGLWYPSN